MVAQLCALARIPTDVNQTNVSTILGSRTIIRKTRVHRLKYWGHIVRRHGEHMLRKALTYQIPGKMKHGPVLPGMIHCEGISTELVTEIGLAPYMTPEFAMISAMTCSMIQILINANEEVYELG